MTSAAAEAERFWQLVGFEEPFPRNLEHVVALALPVSIIRLPRLSPRAVVSWLEATGILWSLSVRARALKGCLVAHKGHGIIFVDGGLSPDEVRVTIGHEVAHFLRHYAWTREIAVSRFGDIIIPVLDGERLASPAERLSGVLQGVKIGPCSHFLDRAPDGAPGESVLLAEDEADLLGLELLAPAKSVVRASAGGDARRRVLQSKYGLPPWAAELWGRHLDARTSSSSFMSQLRKAAEKT